MKAAFTVCLALAVVYAVMAAKPACKSGSYNECKELRYTSDFQTGIYYCCDDADLRPVLEGLFGPGGVTCECYTDEQYCEKKPWEC